MANTVETLVETYLEDNQVTFKADYTGRGVNDNWQHFKWLVTISKVDPLKYFKGFPAVVHEESFIFKMGMAHSTKDKIGNAKPTAPCAASVLHSLLLDAGAERISFESWCDEYGYDVDSRKALQTYLACQETAVKLTKIFTSSQLETLREMTQDY